MRITPTIARAVPVLAEMASLRRAKTGRGNDP
jgi:hypothetical protein